MEKVVASCNKQSKTEIMKTNTLRIFSLGFIMLLIVAAKAQNPVSLYYLENIPQSGFINPAMAPRANAFIGVPGINAIYFSMRNDLFGPNFIQEEGNIGYLLTQREYDHDKLYRSIGKAANFGQNISFSDIYFGFSGKRGYFTFGITEKMSSAFNLPKSFFEMVETGFENGGTLDFAPLGFNASYYREYMAGFSYQLTSQIRVGIHAKLLQGLFSAKTDLEKFDLYTSTDRWTLDMKGDIYMSAPLSVTLNDEGIPDKVEMDEMEGVGDYLDVALTNFSNPGFALDVGAVYDFNEAWTFSASINDLGFINWNGNLNSFSADGKYSWKGLSMDMAYIDTMDTELIIEELTDTIKSVVNYSHGNQGFSSGLGPQLYLGAKYNLTHYLSFGALSRTVFKKYDFQQEFNLSANLNLYHVLTTTFNYTVALSGANSLGFGLGLRGGPVQFYFLADYLPTSYRTYIIEIDEKNEDGDVISTTREEYPGPVDFDSFNFMLGLNILIGPNGFKDSPMIDAYSEF